MDLTTMRALIKSELHINSPYVDGAIADAIEFSKREALKFNGASYNFILEAERYAYPLPEDFVSLRGEVWLTPSGAENTYRHKMTSTTVDMIEESIFTNPSTSSDVMGSDCTFYYAIDRNSDTNPSVSRMLVAPRPTSGGQNVFFRYTKDIGSPKYTATVTSTPPSLSNVTTLLGPSGETLPSDFTNEWFKSGAKLVRARAMYYLWSTYHGGTEEAAIKAQSSLMQWSEELLRLRAETSITNTPKTLRRFI